MHKHHIIPKHMGGSDDPSNIIELTIEEHAEAHRYLFEKYGKIEDKLAWQGLSGLIGKEQILKELVSSVHKGKIETKETRLKKSISLKGNTNAKWNRGIPKSEEHKKKISEAHKHIKKPWLLGNSNALTKHPKKECPKCGKIGGGPNMTRYHFENCKHG